MKKINKWLLPLFIITFVFFPLLFSACDNENNQQPTQPTTYTVTFYDYDRSVIGVKLSEEDDTLTYIQTVNEGESAIAPTSPFREGYEFKGWNKDYSCVNSNLEITALYVQVCEVLFMNDNEIHESQTVEYGKDATLPLINPVKTGYRFDHWEGKYTNILANTLVYAVFVKQYTVTFMGFNGTEINVQIVDENTSATAPQVPQVDGYVFDHWDSDFSNISSNLTVNAVYIQNDSFNVSFVDYNGLVLKQERVYKGTNATAPDITGKVYIDFDSQQKQGYIFDHWDNDFSNVVSDLTVQAVYTQVETPILFVKPETVKKGTTNYVTVSVYVVSCTSFSSLNIQINYDSRLGLTENDVSIKSVFNTQNRYDYELDTLDHQLVFSWHYSSGEYTLADNYSKVMELKFEIDDYISVGEYGVQILNDSYYTKNYLVYNPYIISGNVIVEEV